MAEIEKKNTHGGRRAGAGNKRPVTTKSVTMTLPLKILALMEDQGLSPSKVTTEALKKYFDLS